ncbi:MAG: hypothetical protein R2705_23445 [Ilumatobacteraceae bacterium]
MATSVRPRRQGTAEGVRDDDADAHAQDALGRCLALVEPTGPNRGEQGGKSSLDVREVDAGVGAHEPVPGLGDDEVPSATNDPARLLLDQVLAAAGILRIDRDQSALGLRRDLLGHHEHVAVGERAVRCLGARFDDRSPS